MDRLPEPGEWYTWGTRTTWYRYLSIRPGDGRWVYDTVSTERRTYRWRGVQQPMNKRSGYLVLPLDSPNLPDWVREGEARLFGPLALNADIGPQIERVREQLERVTVTMEATARAAHTAELRRWPLPR